MGCDIHIAIERQDDNGTWREVPWVEPHFSPRDTDDSYARRQWANVDRAIAAEGAVLIPNVFTSRNYDLFGILADVRNGTGFAGVITGEAWDPISSERGFPDDTKIEDDRTIDDFYYNLGTGLHSMGDHSHTYVELDELNKYDWDGTSHQARGLVDWDEWVRFREAGEKSPKSYCGDSFGGAVEKLTEAEAVKRLFTRENIHQSLKVWVFWSETAREATNDWPGAVLPVLNSIAAGRPLRLLLSFDS